MISYLPKKEAILTNPTDEDLRYSEAFDLLAEVLERSGQREKLTLLLSTCRNVYLTVNALFVDLRQTFGHGRKPSLLSQAIYYLRQGEVGDCKARLHETSLALSEFKRKAALWRDRHELTKLLETTLSGARRADRDRLNRILHVVRTSDEDRDQHWDRKFFELSVEEPASAKEAIQMLEGVFLVLDAIVEICRGVCALFEEGSLFEPLGPARLEQLFHKLRENAAALGVQKTGDGEDGISSLSWNTGSGEFRWIKNSLDGLSDSLLSRAVLDLIEERLGDQYNKLNSFFRPNVGVPPLPAPFCIDLTEPERGAGQPSKPVVEVYDFGLERPARIRVALPWLGVPLRFYNTASGRLLDANRAEVEHAVRGLVAAAVEERASVLILPEYILPRTVAPELCRSAAEAGLVLISGVEGQAGGEDSRLLNEALIQLPDQPQPFSQPKRHPSVYERPLVSSGKVKLFKGTSLGTFGVIVCSDLLDWQIVDAFADSRWHVDVLFVCSCNPNFEIYEHLAVADAWRFYRHVVVVNNCMERDEMKASGNGTLISSPKVPPVTRFNEVKGKRDIGVPPIGGCQPQIAIVELSIQGLTTDRVKPTDGLGAFPPSRNVQTVGRA